MKRKPFSGSTERLGLDGLFRNGPAGTVETSIGRRYDFVPTRETNGVNNLKSIWRYLRMLAC